MYTDLVKEFLQAKEREDINAMKDSFLRLLIQHSTMLQNVTYEMGDIFEMIKESPLGTEHLRKLGDLITLYKEVYRIIDANIPRL